MTLAIQTEGLRKVYPPPAARRRGSSARFPGPVPHTPPAGRATSEGIVALEGLDLSVGEGEFFGLLGPNGAGKTTTIGKLTRYLAEADQKVLLAAADTFRAA